nr:molybdopterin dinucleotide binding domain-containing protein [Duganella sp. BJB1802]
MAGDRFSTTESRSKRRSAHSDAPDERAPPAICPGRMFPGDRAQAGQRWPSSTRGDQLPADGALPLLDHQARAPERHSPARSNSSEIGEDLGKEIGVAHGDRVKVSSKRGHIVAKAVVTKRIKALIIDGKKTHQVGLPIHFGSRSHQTGLPDQHPHADGW